MGIGISEIILIIIVGYFLFGPEKLPKVIAEFMKTINSLLKMKDEVLGTVTDIKKDLEGSVAEVKNNLNATAAEVTNELTKPLSEMEIIVNKSMNELNNSIDPKKYINHSYNMSSKEINKS
jgi:Sec-independent protein translocase protein TatA